MKFDNSKRVDTIIKFLLAKSNFKKEEIEQINLSKIFENEDFVIYVFEYYKLIYYLICEYSADKYYAILCSKISEAKGKMELVIN